MNPTASGSAEWNGEWKEFAVSVNIDTQTSLNLYNTLKSSTSTTANSNNSNNLDTLPVEGITAFGR